ncbi:SDR family NAD(P)-dependent oxidoreductase [Cypionkella sp.]|uniref:SDR family oxidoreductase n=1 Tax=Cypionkella sp. TaxID=2811411 RepID=UPI003458B1EE
MIYLRLCSFGGYNAGIGYWGLGRDRCGFGDTLAARGEVVGLSRSGDGLDVTDEASVARVLGGVSGPFDLVMIATGALGVPEKSLRALSGQAMLAQFAVNAVGPALIIKHLLPLLPKDRETRVGVLSARVGSIGDNALGGWYSYRAAKAALNQVVHTAAIEVARSHPLAVLACLHPGKVATSFTAGYPGEKDAPGLSAARLLAVLDGLSPAESGRFYDYAGKIVAW